MIISKEFIMTSDTHSIVSTEEQTSQVVSSPTAQAHQEQDAVESIVPYIPIVLPLAGAVLMFLLASIAIYMA